MDKVIEDLEARLIKAHRIISVYKLNREVVEKRLAEVTKERNRWKANHDNQVEFKRTLLDRPDLKDRAVLEC